MKKGFKAVTAAALAISALTPVAAFAAENTVENGVYTTTNFYSLDAFKKLSGTAKAAALTSEGAVIVVAGKVYTGANVLSLNDTQLDASAVTVDAYNAANGNQLVSGQPIGGTQTGELKVASVSAINATQVEVKFSQKVNKNSAQTHAKYTVSGLDGQSATAATGAVLKSDGKTVVVKFDNPLAKRYQFKVNSVQSADNANITTSYDEVVTFAADTAAPVITGTERISSNQVKIKFSEPVTGGTISAKYADGTAITGLPALTVSGVDELTVNLADPRIDENKDIVVTLNGVADLAGNLLSPQPATVTIVKLPVDGIEPAISTVAQTGAKTFTIKFNKDLDGTTLAAANVAVGGTPATSIKKISADEYEFTMGANLDGLQTVTVAAGKAKDLAGQTNTATLSKLVQFKEDTVAPKATAKVVTNKNNQQVIELTFDKDVTEGNVTVAGSKVKNYVTTTGISETVRAEYADAENEKVLHVPLTGALADDGAAYDVTISSTAVVSDSGVKMDNVKAQFTREKDGQPDNTNTHVVSNVGVAQGGDNNTVLVTFTIPSGTNLDGETATNKANYVIAGAEVESVSLAAPSNATTQVATVKLKEGSNTFTGVRNITVKNVKVTGSTKVMDPKTITNVSLNENVRPTVTKAEVSAITVGSVGSPADPAVTDNVIFTNAAPGGADAGTVAVKSTYNAGNTDKPAVDNVEFEYDTGAWKSNTPGVNVSDFTINVTNGTVAQGDKVTFDLSAYTAAAAPVAASSEVVLTFSENVVPGSNPDFELFIGGDKVTATVATSAIVGKPNQLKVEINKALTAEDFNKGVQLKAASTLDIADTPAGNKLKLDGPINLTLN